MPVRVILLNDQRHLGKRGQVIEVKPGHARNYLLPQGLALEANNANLKYFEQQRTKIDARHAQEKAGAEAIAARLGELTVTIRKRVGETQTLYGSVTASDIAEVLEKKGFAVDRRRIDLTGGIKTIGDHTVRIDLHPEVVAEVTVSVVPEE
jgi:large subunit ribosomal protein L9